VPALLAEPRMSHDCRIAMPARPAEFSSHHWHRTLDRNESFRLLEYALKSRYHFSHPLLFVHRVHREDGWLPVIHASQHPRACHRYLLIEDDMQNTGLGFTGRMLAAVLLFAVRQRRVLLEVLAHDERTGQPVPGRWCDDRPPYTLQCAYEAWTSCALPDVASFDASSSVSSVASYEVNCSCLEHNGGGQGRHVSNCTGHVDSFRDRVGCLIDALREEPVVRMRLSSFYKAQALWTGPGPDAFAVLTAAHRLLFSPRRWVRELASCFMDRHGLTRGGFLSVHVRTSPQKEHESNRGGKHMPESKG